MQFPPLESENQRLRQEIDSHKKLSHRLRDSYVKITQSILSAKHIQRIALPSKKNLTDLFPGAILVDRPRDVVSGDFFLAQRHGNWRMAGVVDSTGHGIPGAMMSMVGNMVFQQTLDEGAFETPGELLDKVNSRLRTRHRDAPQGALGDMSFDASVLAVHDSGRLVRFSGAVMDCIRIRDGEATIWRGDRASLGGSHIGALRRRNGTTQYATLEIEAQPGDQFYLMSDGFKDQFGGEHDRKLGRKRLAEMLAEVGPRSAQERLADIQRFFLLWKGANEQVDDVILVGITH